MERGFDRQDIGDVNSTERGSGARFNTGKVRLDYIPAEVLYNYFARRDRELAAADDDADATYTILRYVSSFEEREHEDEEGPKAARDNLANALDRALRDAGGIDRWRDVADVFHFGAQKYAAWNWAKGMPWSVPLACIKRHCVKILEGEKLDDESGLSHFGHIGCNLVMLLHYLENYPEGDDRPARECFAQEEDDGWKIVGMPDTSGRDAFACGGITDQMLGFDTGNIYKDGVLVASGLQPGEVYVLPDQPCVFDLSLLDIPGGPLEDSEEIVSPETGDVAVVDKKPALECDYYDERCYEIAYARLGWRGGKDIMCKVKPRCNVCRTALEAARVELEREYFGNFGSAPRC